MGKCYVNKGIKLYNKLPNNIQAIKDNSRIVIKQIYLQS